MPCFRGLLLYIVPDGRMLVDGNGSLRTSPRAAVTRASLKGAILAQPFRWIANRTARYSPILALLLVAPPTPIDAQTWEAPGLDAHFAGGELENYLRLLQTAGQVPPQPWSLRPFTLDGLHSLAVADSTHAWSHRLRPAVAPTGELEYALLPGRIRLTANSGFPYGGNDGAVWTGKGFTTDLTAGVAARYGPFRLVLAPTLFATTNAGFRLIDNGLEGERVFADPWNALRIDLPQRFGDGAYTRIEPGQSTLRFDHSGIALGISTANEIWGTTGENPLIMGNNAPGIPRFFAGTSAPLDVWIGRLQGRVIWGRPGQTEHSRLAGDPRWRLLTGYLIGFSPKGIDGLEVGVTRVFHTLVEEGNFGWRHVAKPFEAFLKEGVPEDEPGTGGQDNQLASFFARWVFAPAGLEIYGEYAREDHNWDLRDFLLEPDHQRAYALGMRKVWLVDSGEMYALRTELVNSQPSNIAQVRRQAPIYGHARIAQGHTNEGQLIGSPTALRGGGSLVAVDRYDRNGRWTVSWSRVLGDPGMPLLPELPEDADVQHALGVDGVLFRDRIDYFGQVHTVFHLNRFLEDDQFNLNLSIGARIAF